MFKPTTPKIRVPDGLKQIKFNNGGWSQFDMRTFDLNNHIRRNRIGMDACERTWPQRPGQVV